MLKREIENTLITWKNKQNKKCLIIRGARQVGKTFIIRKFANKYYQNFIEINFIENPSYKKIFENDLNIETILMNISLYVRDAKLVPHKTLIFLDEIQSCPNARTALKFFSIDNRFDVIASGSLLGLNYKEVSSYPTGYVEFINMYPLSFKEFLWANNVNNEIILKLKNCFDFLIPVNETINDKILQYFKEYIVIGGMPNIVDTFIKNHDFNEVITLQRNILIDYRNDITKYADPSEKVKAISCFNSIPGQLAKENKKFMYKFFDKNGRNSKYYGCINWLLDAGIAIMCNNISNLEMPLIAYKMDDYFKIYMADTGLLVSMLDDGTNIEIIEGNLGIYKGAIFENIIAQILHTNGNNLYFYNKNNTLEIDFIITKDFKITPIEVKANNNKSKALSTTLKNNPELNGIKLIYGNVGKKDNLITLPLYMTMFL